MNLKIPPVFVVISAALLMWLIAANVAVGSFDFGAQKIIAYGLITAAIAILIAAVVTFRTAATTVDPTRPERTSNVVTGGVFRISRNPMYLAMLILLTALFVGLGNALNVLVLVGFAAYMTRFQIIPEEQALEFKFGNRYLQYKETVRRWL